MNIDGHGILQLHLDRITEETLSGVLSTIRDELNDASVKGVNLIGPGVHHGLPRNIVFHAMEDICHMLITPDVDSRNLPVQISHMHLDFERVAQATDCLFFPRKDGPVHVLRLHDCILERFYRIPEELEKVANAEHFSMKTSEIKFHFVPLLHSAHEMFREVLYAYVPGLDKSEVTELIHHWHSMTGLDTDLSQFGTAMETRHAASKMGGLAVGHESVSHGEHAEIPDWAVRPTDIEKVIDSKHPIISKHPPVDGAHVQSKEDAMRIWTKTFLSEIDPKLGDEFSNKQLTLLSEDLKDWIQHEILIKCRQIEAKHDFADEAFLPV